MAWCQAPSPCRRRKRGRQNHPATASRRGSGRTPPGLETERRTPPATLADRFAICSPLEHNGNIWPAVNRSQAGPATTIGGAGANGRSLRWNPSAITIYHGQLAGEASVTNDAWGLLIDQAESVLIWKLGIPFNSARI